MCDFLAPEKVACMFFHFSSSFHHNSTWFLLFIFHLNAFKRNTSIPRNGLNTSIAWIFSNLASVQWRESIRKSRTCQLVFSSHHRLLEEERPQGSHPASSGNLLLLKPSWCRALFSLIRTGWTSGRSKSWWWLNSPAKSWTDSESTLATVEEEATWHTNSSSSHFPSARSRDSRRRQDSRSFSLATFSPWHACSIHVEGLFPPLITFVGHQWPFGSDSAKAWLVKPCNVKP